MPIHRLDDHLITQIAAGEVIERPASVTKELVENALDAGATELRVSFEGGGRRRVRVWDNGSGMSEADARLAFERHATSKIGAFEDLRRVSTLGFRGEALASIASVARVELETAGATGDAWRVTMAGDGEPRVEPVTRARGTTVTVDELFFNVPVRRNFLKTAAAELRRCLEVVQGYCLARPDVRFEVEHEGRSLLGTQAGGQDVESLRARIGEVFGAALEEHLSPVGPRPFHAGGEVHGLVGDRSTLRGRRTFVFVNRRLIRDRAVLAVFYRCVRSEWKSEKFPALFLFLELPADAVDVNVHPQKTEVRFRDSGFLGSVSNALTESLAGLRGEEEAPGTWLDPGAGRPALAWRGLGEKAPWEGSGSGAVVAGVAETQEPTYTAKIAQVSYREPAPGRVPLTGRSHGPSALRLLGQYKGTLLLLEGPDGLYLIDQHVAHERIFYERFRRSLREERTVGQQMLEPLVLELSAPEAAWLVESSAELEECGFSIAGLSGGSVAVRAHPAALDTRGTEALLESLLERRADGEGSGRLRDDLLDALAASLSCRAAVKMHHRLSPPEMESLVAELFEAEQPYACPHGRAIVLKMSDPDLEKRFGRR